MVGELLALHAPAIVRRMTVPEARACLRAVYDERRRQGEQQAELMKAMMGAAATSAAR